MRSMQYSTVSDHKHEVIDVHELHVGITASAWWPVNSYVTFGRNFWDLVEPLCVCCTYTFVCMHICVHLCWREVSGLAIWWGCCVWKWCHSKLFSLCMWVCYHNYILSFFVDWEWSGHIYCGTWIWSFPYSNGRWTKYSMEVVGYWYPCWG